MSNERAHQETNTVTWQILSRDQIIKMNGAVGSSRYRGSAANDSRSSTPTDKAFLRSAEQLEAQNDERVEGLIGKVKSLKDVSTGLS